MNRLKPSFKRWGFEHELWWRRGDIAVFQRSKPGQQPHFETVLLRALKPTRFSNGEELPVREIYPRTYEWGKRGWTYGTFEEAMAKALRLEQANTTAAK